MPVEGTVRRKERWRRYSPKAWMEVVPPVDIFWGLIPLTALFIDTF